MTLPTVGALRISALMPAQLMDLSVRYWEGAVTVHAPGNAAEIGQGYLEMTGY
jgi:predicted secreted hydrolase